MSLVVINVAPIREFGIVASMGVLIAFVLTYSMVPLFRHRLNGGRNNKAVAFTEIVKWSLTRRHFVLGTTLVIVLLGVLNINRLEIDAYLLKDLPEESQIKKSFKWADQNIGGSKPWMYHVSFEDTKEMWKKIKEIELMLDQLKKSHELVSFYDPVSLLKYLNFIESGQYVLPNSENTKQLIPMADQLYRKVNPEPIPFIIAGLIPEFGSHATQNKDDAFREFVTTLDLESAGKITGTNQLIDKSHSLLSGKLVSGLSMAILAIGLVIGLFYRSVKLGFLATIPSIISLLLMCSFIYYTGMELQLTNSIIFAVAFGIIVDDSIHFIGAFQKTKGSLKERMEQTMLFAGQGILDTSIVLIAGFSILCFSSFGATYHLGVFMLLALILALISVFTVLPVILSLFANHKSDSPVK
jgi:hypothetical protein